MTLPLQSDFATCNWDDIAETQHPGERGMAYWRTQQYGAVRVRRVRYSADYLADHWCERGHVLYVLDGRLVTELKDGREIVLAAGMSIRTARCSSSSTNCLEGYGGG
ncbi:MAG: DHCW motif cupin fold protein [Vulcanimicrobiaceae bacterium]